MIAVKVLQMAKKRQLNVRLPDALLDELEERVQKTKMGMAAMVEVLLVQALQHQTISVQDVEQGDRLDDLTKRIEALETKLADASNNSHINSNPHINSQSIRSSTAKKKEK